MKRGRLIMREFKVSDWRGVHDYASVEAVCRYQPWGPNTIEDSRGFVRQVLTDREEEPRIRYAFAVTARDEQFIGAGELNIKSFNHRSAEIGYMVNPAFWRQGIGTEIAEQLLVFGFRKLKMHRIAATCDVRNTGSQKVLENIGMMREGTVPDHLLLADGWRDSFLYSILAPEWEKGRKNGR
ncbi:GNAT family N-acetyltransferase [Planococcus lenghuensis]|uniref:GNAT family N-acetyltransferase n=2 Tax=Planococcus lenghuensis TaxID=2213202 RepID=A0A1Q2L3L0_9BACL|nr:GNAT family N-acetyltransferase [Planococcus lenghuensis]